VLKVVSVIVGLFILVGCQSGEPQPQESSGEPMEHPWSGCGVDSFVHYKRLLFDRKVIEEKMTVVETYPDHVLLEVSEFADPEWKIKGLVNMPVGPIAKPPDKEIPSKEETITVAGKSLKCKVTEHISRGPQGNEITRIYISKDVPGSYVRSVRANTVVFEVINFAKK
jgi:hypothetical protein